MFTFNMYETRTISEIIASLDRKEIEDRIRRAIGDNFIRMEIINMDPRIEIFVVTEGNKDWEEVCLDRQDYLTEYFDGLRIHCWFISFIDEHVTPDLFDVAGGVFDE